MARKIGQIRYFGEKNKQNYPTTINAQRLRSGNAFSSVYPIIQLGVQTLPGIKFHLNNHSVPIIVGATGIYELDVEGLSNITDIQFDEKSLTLINENQNAYIIIDYIYETE